MKLCGWIHSDNIRRRSHLTQGSGAFIRSMAVRKYNQYEMTVITATVSESAVIGEDYTTPLLENTQ